MRSIVVALVTLACGLAARPTRADTFDVATFTVPTGWTTDPSAAAVALQSTDNATQSYCVIKILKSVASSGDARGDFDKDWRELVAAPYKIEKPPAVTRPKRAGWTVHAGASTFKHETHTANVSLTTHVGGGKVVTVVSVWNHKRCKRPVAAFMKALALATPSSSTGTPTAQDTAPTGTSPGFQFTQTNFDEGWTATIQSEWVLVEKGDAKVRLYYVLPYDASKFSGTGVADRDYYWDNFVATPFQASTKGYRDDGAMALKPKYIEGWGVDPATRQKRFFAMHLLVAPNTAMIVLASTPDDATLRALFPRANDALQSDLGSMTRFNKFAIGANDLAGTWQSGGSQMTQWYDARTGAYSGATFAATSATFSFVKDGTYRSVHNGASGAVGNMGTFQQDYRGTYKVSNYSVTATKRYQGRTDTFDAHFQAVRGGRLLFLDDKRGGSYLLVRIK